MKRPQIHNAFILAILALLICAVPAQAKSVQIVDDAGHTIALQQAAKRVIPLYGAFTEMLYAIGAGSQVVARTLADRFPRQVRQLPSVGTHMRPNVEMILGLKPDLVIESASRRAASPELQRLRDAGIPVAVFAPETFQGIFVTMRRLGVLTGHQQQAIEATAHLQKRLNRVESRLKNLPKRRRVFFEVRSQPLTGAGQGSIVQQILAAAGAENVVQSRRAMVLFNFEALLMANPDFYIVQEGPMNRNPVPPGQRPDFSHLRAVRQGHVLDVSEFLYSRPGPRCVDAVERLAARLYPDRFKSHGKLQ